jgi:hypothetical protein
MTNNLLVIISSGEEAPDKALTGLMYAINAKKHSWLDDVHLMFFGPSEAMVAKAKPDSQLGQMLKQAFELGMTPVACKAISDGNNITTELKGLGIETEYVGTILSSYVKKDYQILTF